MDLRNIPPLKIGNFVAKIPIIQGGMSVGISLSGLASAVAKEGGIGVIGAAGIGMLEPDFKKNFREANKRALKKEIRKAKSATDGIIGVNIMVALSDFDELGIAAVEEGADIIFMGAGLPLRPPRGLSGQQLRDFSAVLVPIVSSPRAADLIIRYWTKNYDKVPDALVVEGPKAGGHLGFKREQIEDPNFQLEVIFPQVLETVRAHEEALGVKIPVIAAGGIYTGEDIYRYMSMGAAGVQMGTRFVATYECDASDAFKEAYIKCKKEDIIIIQSPVGLPGRAIRNKFLEDVERGMKKPFTCPWKCLKTCNYKESPYCIALALTNAKRGDLLNGYAFIGANGYRVDRIMHVKELIEELITGYNEALKRHSSGDGKD